MQKKAYRVLEEMCGGEREECRTFVVSNLETLKVVLLETLKNASSPAKRVRLPCRERERNEIQPRMDVSIYFDLQHRLIVSLYMFSPSRD